jgi:predicted AAA+ superfamily ATPase
VIRRRAEAQVRDALEDTPVVLIHGPRQAGKSTLTKEIGLPVVTLDDATPLDLARRRPEEFLHAYPAPIAIDEVQRAPELFRALKAAIDRDRKPGSYLLTGSANVLALPRLADSLAGRMEVVDLPPLSAAEIAGSEANFVEALFNEDFRPTFTGDPSTLPARLAAGGFPEPLARKPARRGPWFEAYLRTMLERDVRDLANVEGLAQLPRLLSRIASRAGATQNLTGLSRETGIPATTLTRYVELLRAVFLVFPVPAWSSDGEGVRLARTPKVHLVDSGLQAHLLRLDERALSDPEALDPVLRTFVAGELRKLLPSGVSLAHLRSARNQEVEFVLDGGALGIVGIDVRPYRTVTTDDARGLRFLAELAGDRFRIGIILHPGDRTVPLGDRLYALPVDALWS